MTPTQALKHALDLEQERSRTLEAVVKALQTELKAEKAKATTLRAQFDELRSAALPVVEQVNSGATVLLVKDCPEASGWRAEWDRFGEVLVRLIQGEG